MHQELVDEILAKLSALTAAELNSSDRRRFNRAIEVLQLANMLTRTYSVRASDFDGDEDGINVGGAGAYAAGFVPPRPGNMGGAGDIMEIYRTMIAEIKDIWTKKPPEPAPAPSPFESFWKGSPVSKLRDLLDARKELRDGGFDTATIDAQIRAAEAALGKENGDGGSQGDARTDVPVVRPLLLRGREGGGERW